MTKEEEEILNNIKLDANEWRGVMELRNALSEFEPLAKRGALGEVVAERIVGLGLAEKGQTSGRYVSIGMRVGYRLTDLGWKIADRGRLPRRDIPTCTLKGR